MALLHDHLTLGVPLRDALAWVGVRAGDAGNKEAEAACRKLAQNTGPSEVDVHVPVIHILCQACDFLRAQGEHEAVAEIERIIQLLKMDMPPRLVVGRIDFSDPMGLEKAARLVDDLRERVSRG